jgi:1-acyl-sn-glycerol-3-phosphate acyltransferase
MPLGRRVSGLVHGLALGGVLYGFLVLVFLVSLPVAWRRSWAERVICYLTGIAVPLALWGGRVRVHGTGAEHAASLDRGRGYILIANHSSNLDPLALMKVLGRVDMAFVAKAETLRRPLLGRLLRAVGWFPVERDSLVALKRFQEQVEARRRTGWVPNLVVFPEGTRSEDGRLQPFRMGPFLLSVRTGIPILPVIIRGTHPLHRRNAFAVYPGTVRVDFLPPIDPPAGKLGAADLVAAVEALQRRVVSLYRAVPDLNHAGGALPALEIAAGASPSGSRS